MDGSLHLPACSSRGKCGSTCSDWRLNPRVCLSSALVTRIMVQCRLVLRNAALVKVAACATAVGAIAYLVQSHKRMPFLHCGPADRRCSLATCLRDRGFEWIAVDRAKAVADDLAHDAVWDPL